MRLLKSFFITILGFFVVITLVSLLMPSEVITSRTVSMNANAADVMREVGDLNNWSKWHPLFSQKDLLITQSSNGRSATWSMHGKTNRLDLVKISPQQLIFHLASSGENTQENKITVTDFKDSTAVNVEWAALTRLKWYPWEKFSGIFVDKITGSGYEAALNSLKAFLESPKTEN